MAELALVLAGIAAATAIITLVLVSVLLARREPVSQIAARLDSLESAAARSAADARADFARAREESATASRAQRTELAETLARMQEQQRLGAKELRDTVEQRLQAMQKDNADKLEMMRQTVDEKLHATLEQRLSESFKLVSDRLELVHRGLGEMQALASNVGDLKKVLANVKTRGGLGEVQLAALLEQILASEQYATNVATRPGSRDRVEFAIRLPGQDAQHPVWLPIDAKFPTEDYQRLQEAQEAADPQGMEIAAKALEARLRVEARSIADKYLEPPATTEFGLLYLPVEGLYAEALRRPGLFESLQRESRVVLCGPTTLVALLNSLQMGFRTLAIEKRSSEVWSILGAVKSEFGRFGDVLAQTKKQLQTVANSIDAAEVRTRQIEKKLKDVESLPEPAVAELIERDPQT